MGSTCSRRPHGHALGFTVGKWTLTSLEAGSVQICSEYELTPNLGARASGPGREARLTCHVPDGLLTIFFSQWNRLHHVSPPLLERLSLYSVRCKQGRAEGPKEAWRAMGREGQQRHLPEPRPASGVLDRPFTRCRTLGNYFVYFYLPVQRCVIPTLQGLSWGWMILNIGECLPGWPLVIALQRLHLPKKVRCHFPEMLSEAPRPFLEASVMDHFKGRK